VGIATKEIFSGTLAVTKNARWFPGKAVAMRSLRTQPLLKLSAALILSVVASPVAGQQPTMTQLPAVTQAVVPVQAVAPLAASPQYPSPTPAEYLTSRADVPIDPAVRLASLPSGPERRMVELEQRFADLEARMAAQTLTSSAQPTAAPPAAAPGGGSVVGADTDMPAKWNFGFEAQSKDKVFRAKFGGQLQFDYTDYNQATQLTTTPINAPPGDPAGGIGRQNESVNFRRLRLRSEGTMYENVGWVVQPDFANAANVSNVPGNPPGFPNSLNQAGFPAGQTIAIVPSLTDCYVTVMKLPVVNNLRIGNFKEPTGLEHMTSSRFLDFMERNYIQDMIHGPFNNGFSPGAMFFNWTEQQNSTWQLWGGPNQANLFGYHVGQGEWAGTMRGTYLPYYDEASNGRYMVHLGTSLSARKPDQGQDRFRIRGDLRDGPPSTLNTNYLDSGSFLTDFQYIISPEFLAIWGPWTVQAEYMGTFLQDTAYNILNNQTPGGVPITANIPSAQQALFNAFLAGQGGGNVYFQATYVEVLYFLTGESRGYDRRMGICDRIVPINNFFWTSSRDGGACGWGAWQVGARYNYVNLNSGLINGGILNSITLGINWFLNPNLKFQFNYDITYRSQVAQTDPGWINAGGLRLAFDF
jgi:phosphate-selective porin OprO/OprP